MTHTFFDKSKEGTVVYNKQLEQLARKEHRKLIHREIENYRQSINMFMQKLLDISNSLNSKRERCDQLREIYQKTPSVELAQKIKKLEKKITQIRTNLEAGNVEKRIQELDNKLKLMLMELQLDEEKEQQDPQTLSSSS